MRSLSNYPVVFRWWPRSSQQRRCWELSSTQLKARFRHAWLDCWDFRGDLETEEWIRPLSLLSLNLFRLVLKLSGIRLRSIFRLSAIISTRMHLNEDQGRREPCDKADLVIQENVQRKWQSYLWDTLDKSPEERTFLFKLDFALLTFASLGASSTALHVRQSWQPQAISLSIWTRLISIMLSCPECKYLRREVKPTSCLLTLLVREGKSSWGCMATSWTICNRVGPLVMWSGRYPVTYFWREFVHPYGYPQWRFGAQLW